MNQSLRALTVVFALVVYLTPFSDVHAQRGDREGKKSEAKTDEKKSKIKPYEEVITDEAITSKGLFKTHSIDDKLFYEIPTERLGKDMLWVVQIEKTQSGFSYAGMPVKDRIVRWERRGD